MPRRLRLRARWAEQTALVFGAAVAALAAAALLTPATAGAEPAEPVSASSGKPAAVRAAPEHRVRPAAVNLRPPAAAASLRERTGRRPVPPAERQMRVTVLRGTNLGLPPLTVPLVRRVTGTATFTADSTYDLKSVDQFDWNKLTGIGFSIPANINSIQVGWRYNLATGLFEVSPVFNVDDTRVLPSPAEIISVPVGQRFSFDVDYGGITLSYGDERVFKPTPVDLKTSWFSFRTWTWFGGTSPAPRTLSLLIRAD